MIIPTLAKGGAFLLLISSLSLTVFGAPVLSHHEAFSSVSHLGVDHHDHAKTIDNFYEVARHNNHALQAAQTEAYSQYHNAEVNAEKVDSPTRYHSLRSNSWKQAFGKQSPKQKALHEDVIQRGLHLEKFHKHFTNIGDQGHAHTADQHIRLNNVAGEYNSHYPLSAVDEATGAVDRQSLAVLDAKVHKLHSDYVPMN